MIRAVKGTRDILPPSSDLWNAVEQKARELDRVKVAGLLEISVSTAGNYMQLLAQEYPKAMTYARGVLMIVNDVPTIDIPMEVRMRGKEKQIAQIKELTEKIKTNHLNHKDLDTIKKSIEELKKKVDLL